MDTVVASCNKKLCFRLAALTCVMMSILHIVFMSLFSKTDIQRDKISGGLAIVFNIMMVFAWFLLAQYIKYREETVEEPTYTDYFNHMIGSWVLSSISLSIWITVHLETGIKNKTVTDRLIPTLSLNGLTLIYGYLLFIFLCVMFTYTFMMYVKLYVEWFKSTKTSQRVLSLAAIFNFIWLCAFSHQELSTDGHTSKITVAFHFFMVVTYIGIICLLSSLEENERIIIKILSGVSGLLFVIEMISHFVNANSFKEAIIPNNYLSGLTYVYFYIIVFIVCLMVLIAVIKSLFTFTCWLLCGPEHQNRLTRSSNTEVEVV
jgi:hypothetical protein